MVQNPSSDGCAGVFVALRSSKREEESKDECEIANVEYGNKSMIQREKQNCGAKIQKHCVLNYPSPPLPPLHMRLRVPHPQPRHTLRLVHEHVLDVLLRHLLLVVVRHASRRARRTSADLLLALVDLGHGAEAEAAFDGLVDDDPSEHHLVNPLSQRERERKGGGGDSHGVNRHRDVPRERHEVRPSRVVVRNRRLRRRVPRASSNAHHDEPAPPLRVLPQVLRAQREDHGITNRLEEEQREEAADARAPGCERRGEGEDAAAEAVERQEERGVDKVEDADADEAAHGEGDLAVGEELGGGGFGDADVLVDHVVYCEGGHADLGSSVVWTGSWC